MYFQGSKVGNQESRIKRDKDACFRKSNLFSRKCQSFKTVRKGSGKFRCNEGLIDLFEIEKAGTASLKGTNTRFFL